MIPDRMPDKVQVSGEQWLEPAGEGRSCASSTSNIRSTFSESARSSSGSMASATAESFAKQVDFTCEYIRRRPASAP